MHFNSSIYISNTIYCSILTENLLFEHSNTIYYNSKRLSGIKKKKNTLDNKNVFVRQGSEKIK